MPSGDAEQYIKRMNESVHTWAPASSAGRLRNSASASSICLRGENMCWPVMEGLESEPTLFIDAPYSALNLYIF